MKIFGLEIKREEILKRFGDITQFGGIKYYEFIDGVSKGIRAIDVKCPCGLDMTILVDRGMDISNLYYQSVPISWISSTKITSPGYFDPRNKEWLRSFYGGLLNTFINDSPRISNIGAENVCFNGRWINDSYVIVIEGKVRDVKIYGNKLELTRNITTWMDDPKIIIEDSIENIGSEKSPISFMYHINIGYPIIDRSSKLLESKAKIIPKDEESKKNINNCINFSEPQSEAKELNYIHDVIEDSEGYSNVAIVNESFNNGNGIGIWLRYIKSSLPYLIHWKQMGGPEYVCGICPTNDFCRGIEVEKEEDMLRYIEPGEKIKYKLEFIILTSNKDIESFKNKYSIK